MMNMRKIGINTRARKGVTPEKLVPMLKEFGFDMVFSSVWEREEMRRATELLYAAGISYDTLHAPFKQINEIWSEGEAGAQIYAGLINCIDVCREVGAPIAVVHLSGSQQSPPPTDLGRKRFIELVDYAATKGVKIAFENIKSLANLAWAMEEFQGAEHVGFCWDCGHEACFTPGIKYMPLFADRLICTHLHDNCGKINEDLHRLPFDGNLDFVYIANQIQKSGYTGTLMLEVNGDSEVYSHLSDEAFFARASEAMRQLCDLVENGEMK